MVILDPTLDERTVAPSLETFLNVIRKDGGTVEKIDIWGRRRLAYEILKHPEGIYAVIDVKAEPATVVRAGSPAQPQRVRPADQGDADRQALGRSGVHVRSASVGCASKPYQAQEDPRGCCDTNLTIVGNLTADPELRFTPSGAAVANFTVASTPSDDGPSDQ